MSLVAHTFRLILGLSMLAAAVMLALPFAQIVVAVAPGRPFPPQGAPPALPGLEIGISGGAAGHAIPDPRMPPAADPAVQAPPGSQWPDIPPAGPQPRFVPPPAVTAPLPPNRIEISPATPPLDGTYRSTVDIPPPPLLDVHAAPPLAAGWTTRPATRPAPAAARTAADQSSEYVIRDGDDLTGIALRTYGQAAAASAIWNANRDRLTDPNVLPIGLVLELPPAWMLPAGSAASAGGRSTSIEPGLAADRGMAGVPPGGGGVPHAASPWLSGQGPATAMPTVQSSPASFTGPATSRPRTIRVGPGDSLESLAVTVYGDRTRAPALWQANRDRLRSPDLLVPGMELRVP